VPDFAQVKGKEEILMPLPLLHSTKNGYCRTKTIRFNFNPVFEINFCFNFNSANGNSKEPKGICQFQFPLTDTALLRNINFIR
jgi:hypothetical protein